MSGACDARIFAAPPVGHQLRASQFNYLLSMPGVKSPAMFFPSVSIIELCSCNQSVHINLVVGGTLWAHPKSIMTLNRSSGIA